MSDPSLHAILLVVLLSAIAAVWDLRTGEIPNRLVALGALGCVVAVLAASLPAGGASVGRALLSMLAGAALVALVPLVLFRAGGMGGGDVKLLAVVGAALGPFAGVEAEMYAFVAALLYAPVRLLWEGKLVHAMRTTGALAVRPLLPKHRRPAPVALEELTALRFAPAIFIGVLVAVAHHLGGGR
ncbi:MAG: A24 family peptidase [Polyangiales bacterium]